MGIIDSIERRAIAETNLDHPEWWFLAGIGATPTSSGVRVNEHSAMTLSPVFACVNAIAKDVAQVKLHLYERRGRSRERATDHPAYRLVHDRPNPELVPATFKQMIQAHALMWGGGFIEIEQDANGRPLALWPLLPDRTYATRVDGEKFIVTMLDTGKQVGIPSRRVIQLPGLTFDGLNGMSLGKLARQAIGLGMAAEEFAALWFKNGSRVSGVIEHPNKLSEAAHQRLRDDFERMHQGLSNAHRIAILEEGMKWHQTGVPPNEAQLLDSRKFDVENVARFFDVPLVRIHHTEKSTSWGSGVAEFNRGYLLYTIGYWLTLWEEALSEWLLMPSERGRFYFEFLRESLLQGDHKARAELYKALFATAAISPNEIRERENMNPKPGLDRYFVPSNTAELTEDGVIPASIGSAESREEPGEARRALPVPEGPAVGWAEVRRRTTAAHMPALREVARRVVASEARALRRAVHKAGADVAQLWVWASEYAETRSKEWIEALSGPVTALAGSLEAAAAVLFGRGLEELPPAECLGLLEQVGEAETKRLRDDVASVLRRPPEEHEEAFQRLAERWEAERPDEVAGTVVIPKVVNLVTRHLGIEVPDERSAA